MILHSNMENIDKAIHLEEQDKENKLFILYYWLQKNYKYRLMAILPNRIIFEKYLIEQFRSEEI